MTFNDYYDSLDAEQKKAFAEALGTSVPYLYQLRGGNRNAGAGILLRIERATGGAVTPDEMRGDAANKIGDDHA
jgi:DNA-binding transcriptional regulator YdaS (Cro superfamily)